MEIKPGDKLLHITKYGGKNIIEVMSVEPSTYKWDTELNIVYELPEIRTTQGVFLHTDGSDGILYKIDRFINKEELRKYNKIMKEWEEKRTKYFEQMRKGEAQDVESDVERVGRLKQRGGKKYYKRCNIMHISI